MGVGMVPSLVKMGLWGKDFDQDARSQVKEKQTDEQCVLRSHYQPNFGTKERHVSCCSNRSRHHQRPNRDSVCEKPLPLLTTKSSSVLSSSVSSSSSPCLVLATSPSYLKLSPVPMHFRRGGVSNSSTTAGMPIGNALCKRLSLSSLTLPPLCFYFLLIAGTLFTPCAAICPPNCTCDDATLVVRCDSAMIDVLPYTFNPSLQRLTMYGTHIHTLDLNSLRWYQDLRHVNLSKNMIMRVMPKTFELQNQLEELHLAQNNISDLEADMFLGLSNLIVLSLRGNSIESLDGEVFMHLRQLKDLDLSDNRLERIDDHSLAGLSNLRVLHLHDNRLASVPSQNLALVPDLAYLSLGGNEFLKIQEGELHSLRTLKDLDLSGAQLGDGLTVGSFKGLTGLRKLMLEDCGIREVPTAALGPLTKLEELHIGRNLISSLPPNSFANNRHLYSLYVSGSPNLMYVDKDVLHNNVNIKQVVITQNPQLTYIAEDAFRFLSELSLLDLHGNNIQMISENAASWSDIEKWSLEGNPIACNCSAAWLRELTLTQNSSSSVRCASPPSLSGVPLYLTKLSDLACGMDAATQGLVIGIVVLILVVIIAAVVVMMLYRHHGSCVHRLLKGHRLDRHSGGFGHHTCSHDNYQGYIMTPQKPVPVTEL